MIFALGEDGELSVFEDLAAVRQSCEGIDVESGVWDFFDESGKPLQPVFRKPNKVRTIFGSLASVESGEFHFEAARGGSEPSLLELLADGTPLQPNPRFGSLQEVREFLLQKSSNP